MTGTPPMTTPLVQMTGATSSKQKGSLFNNRLITESELRAFVRCSEFSFRGGLVELPLRTALIDFAYVNLILHMMRNENFDYKYRLNQVLLTAHRHLSLGDMEQSEKQELLRVAALGVEQIFQTLPPNLYLPVFGAFEYPVKISKTSLMLRVSSILMTRQNLHDWTKKTVVDKEYRSKTIHAVTFSPYSIMRDISSDPVQQVKALTLAASNPVRVNPHHIQVKLHVFSASNHATDLNYTYIQHRIPIDYSTWGQYLEAPMKLLEANYHYPVVPCLYACPYKNVCQPTPFITRETGGEHAVINYRSPNSTK